MRSRFFFALLVLAFPSALRAAPALIPPEEILRVSSIRPGMRGYGLTVFRGTRIERFDVQVIDILRRDYLGRDMLLVRMRGGPITERGANIIAGMSGSPIYLGGKLAGAVSMGWGFPKEPVAIVTPIEAMADAFDPRLPQKPLLTSLPAAFEEPRAAGAEWPSAEHALFPAGQGMVGPAYGTYTPYRSEEAAPLGSGPLPTRRPLMTPLFTHGLSPANVRRLGALVAPFGLEVAAGAGGRALDTGDIPFRAGAGIGVYLATGDIEIGGTGTLTYRKGNRILAFGHPMFQFGAVDLPMTTVHIHDVASTYSRSFKLASMARVVGAITQDGPFSIAGRVHRMPRMIPLEIAVNDTGSGRRQTFRVQAASHPILSGRIIEMAASEGIARVRAFPGEAMARVRLRVEAENLPPIVRENGAFDYFDPNCFGYSALRELEELVGILNGSPFGQVPIRRVAVSITLSPGRRTATIERAWVDRDRVEPGETVRVSAVLRPWKGTPEVKALDVKVPAGTPDGRAFLYVAGGASSLPARPSMGGFFFIRDVGRPGAAAPATNVRQLVRRYLERERNDHLVARLFLPGPSGSVGGERLLRLPPPLAEVMRSAKATGFFPMLEEVKERVSLDRVVGGTQMIPITIERRSLAEKRGAGRPAASSSGSPPLPMPSPSGMPHASIGNDYAAAPPPREGAAVLAPPRPPGVAPLPQSDRPHPSDRSNADNDDEEDTPALSSREGTGARRRPGRQVVFWRQRSYQDWERGDTKGTVATSDGTIRLVPTVMSVRPFAEENCIWAMASDAAGNFAVGTGSDGRLYRRTFDGKVRLLLDAPEAQILAVACDARGSVYAGTAPGGVIYRVRPDGAAVTYFRTGERFVLSLALDAAGNLYAGTGPSGRIFRVAPDGKGSVYFTTSEPHVMRLAMDGKGALLAGTAGGGVVYRITGAGQGTALLDTGDSAVGGLALDRQGGVVAGTAPRGLVVREGRAKPLYEARAPILALAAGSDGSLYAGAGANLVRLEGEDSAAKLSAASRARSCRWFWIPRGSYGPARGTPPASSPSAAPRPRAPSTRWSAMPRRRRAGAASPGRRTCPSGRRWPCGRARETARTRTRRGAPGRPR